MPRILPRLIEKLGGTSGHEPPWEPFRLNRNRPKSLYKPIPPRPSFDPANHPKSLLLSLPEANPITASRIYVRHKTLPPAVHLSRHAKARPLQHDCPRSMTDEERCWWSNPYLRMLASPLRKCIVTERYLPTDFLIRLSRVPVPHDLVHNKSKESSPLVFIPDGLQHSKFAHRSSGSAVYILCNKGTLSIMSPRSLKALQTSIHPFLTEHIGHLLRVRVLQELERLGNQMECYRSRSKSNVHILRRLTRDEWRAVRETGLIPFPGALAILVVPPLRRNPETKKRPEPSMTTAPITEQNVETPKNPSLPICTLHEQTNSNLNATLDCEQLPQTRIPLYNCVYLYPLKQQRAALFELLTRILNAERKMKRKILVKKPTVTDFPQGQRASHAFLLSSDTETLERGDPAAVAIALWRLRMFEQEAFAQD